MTLFLPPHTVCAGLFLAWTWRLHGVGQQMETARSYYNQPNCCRPKDVTLCQSGAPRLAAFLYQQRATVAKINLGVESANIN